MQGNEVSGNAVIFNLAFLLSAFGYEFMIFVMTVHICDLTGRAMNVGLFHRADISAEAVLSALWVACGRDDGLISGMA
ncbi:MAG: hypothetical protein H6Q82_886 [Deltaproteobacteria bacterium]|nr:hypothetical protein [Deltaproteobacteria bacterium]MBP2682076.1 hypothetical protein [Deltaproteobacteria bacterium]MBP2685140.1 hypothetical protein [Deltaproteobacteria bacterium]